MLDAGDAVPNILARPFLMQATVTVPAIRPALQHLRFLELPAERRHDAVCRLDILDLKPFRQFMI
jgi:hypothetical protein